MSDQPCRACGRRTFLLDSACAMIGVIALWRIGPSARYPIPTADGATVDRDNQVILVRWQNAAYAFALSCPHQNTALRWEAENGQFQCPKHHSIYQPDGTFVKGRATRNMDRLAIRRDGEALVVDVDAMFSSADDLAGWAAAMIHL